MRSVDGTQPSSALRKVVLPDCVPPATTMFSPATTEASRKSAACVVSMPSPTRSLTVRARTTNRLTLTAQCSRVMSGMATCSRLPSGSIASTNGLLRSRRRPDTRSMRSTRARTCASSMTTVVSSLRPSRAMKMRSGALIQTSSTVGSSKNRCSGPNPAIAWNTDVPTVATSSTGPSPRDSCIAASTRRRTASGSRSGSIPWARTSSRTRPSTNAPVSMPRTLRRNHRQVPRPICGLWTTRGRLGMRLSPSPRSRPCAQRTARRLAVRPAGSWECGS